MIFFNFLGDQTDVICQREYYYKTNHQTNKVTPSDQTPDMYKHIKIKAKIYNKNKTILLCKKRKGRGANQRVTFTGLKGEALVVHGLCVELGKGVGGAAEGRVHATIHLVQARGVRLPLLRHGR